jgi:hypothetical protein
MPTASSKAMIAAQSQEFQARVRLALVRTALLAIDDENSARAAFARKVLAASVNLPAAAVAVVANAAIGASIAGAAEGDDTFGVADADIGFTVAADDDPATGVFDKLARANQ